MVIGGDVLLGRGVARAAGRGRWAAQLAGVAPLLRAADLAIVNLESPFGPCLGGGTVRLPRLCGDPAGLAALTAAGVGAVTLANNHALDAGKEGLVATAALLRRHGITPLGVPAALTGRPQAEPLGRLQVVAVNLTPPAHPPGAQVPLPSPAAIARVIAQASQSAPARPVLVILHLGREMDAYPSPRDRAHAEAAVGAGAAAVVMHGAHVRRQSLRDRGVPVHLGLGNLRFDQRDPRARQGALLTLGFRPGPTPGTLRVNEIEEFCVDSLSGTPVRCLGVHRSHPEQY